MNPGLIPFLNFCLNALITIVLLAFSRRSLERIRKLMDLLSNGGFRDCPFYRTHDSHREDLPSTMKGGEEVWDK